MDDQIEKFAVYDDRIIQHAPKYAISRGAGNLSSMPFRANTESSSQHQYTIQAPNQGVFMDRSALWSSQVALQMTATVPWSAMTTNLPVCSPGLHFALAAYPLHRLVNNMNANINNQQVTFNGDTMNELIRLVDTPANRKRRGCPTMLDTFGNYSVAGLSPMNPIGSMMRSPTQEDVANGAHPELWFTKPDGTALSSTDTSYTSPSGVVVACLNGVPVVSAADVTAKVAKAYPIYISFRSSERLMLSPFIFSEAHDRDTGMFGINNIMVTMSMTNPNMTGHTGRVIRACNTNDGVVISGVAYNATTQSGNAFSNSRIDCQFLDPSWSVALPKRSIVPYMDVSKTQSVAPLGLSQVVPSGGETTIVGSSSNMPYIPDLIIISVRPEVYAADDADYTFPITKLSLQWANRPGMLSTHTQAQLYDMSVQNGLDMSWPLWSGQAKGDVGIQSANAGSAATATNVQMVGGFVVLRPGIDFPMDNQFCPGMTGNFTFQANVSFKNTRPAAIGTNELLHVNVITIGSGFFNTLFGTSMLQRSVVVPQDAVAQLAQTTHNDVTAMVGGGLFSKLSNVATKAWRHLPLAKQALGALKPMLNQDHQDLLSAVGVGDQGGNYAGGNYAGGNYAGGGKRRLMERV